MPGFYGKQANKSAEHIVGESFRYDQRPYWIPALRQGVAHLYVVVFSFEEGDEGSGDR